MISLLDLLAATSSEWFGFWEYNTRVVLLGTTLLGACSGVVGTFMLLRRQALVGDLVSHAALPGVALAFLVSEACWPQSGRTLSHLLVGATASSLAAIGLMSLIQRYSPIKPDAALATVLGVFFGGGAVLMTVVQDVPSGNQAGLQHFILGTASTMIASDVEIIAMTALVALVICSLLFKELSILAFDAEYALTQGWNVKLLDLALLLLVVVVTVIGLQSVGVMMVALLITPATAARCWTQTLSKVVWLAGLFGGGAAFVGCLASTLIPKLAGGPTIVLAGSLLFVVSLFFGTERGLWRRWSHQRDVRRRVGRHDLLRAVYEILEAKFGTDESLTVEQLTRQPTRLNELQAKRRWTARRLRHLIDENVLSGFLRWEQTDGWRLTQTGAIEALRVVRNHRLWELYLIKFADFGAAHVDRLADDIEHVIEPEVLAQLEGLVEAPLRTSEVPPSPHA